MLDIGYKTPLFPRRPMSVSRQSRKTIGIVDGNPSLCPPQARITLRG